jgi:hypothetical protein
MRNINTIAIVGSRNFLDYAKFVSIIDKLLKTFNVATIVSGGAKGVDSLARKYANDNQINLIELLTDWHAHGKSAGFIRNIDIVDKADLVFAIWDGKSKGTKHSIDISNKQQKLTIVFNYIENTYTATNYLNNEHTHKNSIS